MSAYLDRINRVVDYIDDHLQDRLTLGVLARVGCFSECHFHRVFKAVMGENLAPFVKRMRLEKAARLLHHGSGRDLTEIAIQCGFRSSSDFSRSFRAHFGVPPSSWKTTFDGELPARPSPNFPGMDRPELLHNPDGFLVRLESWPTRRFAYVRIINAYVEGRAMAGYETMKTWAEQRDLTARWVGMSKDDPDITPAHRYRYDIGMWVDPRVKADGPVGVRSVPGGRYAVMPVEGDIARVARAWEWMFRHWLPDSGYEPRHEPAVEVFRKGPDEIGWYRYDLLCCVPIRPTS